MSLLLSKPVDRELALRAAAAALHLAAATGRVQGFVEYFAEVAQRVGQHIEHAAKGAPGAALDPVAVARLEQLAQLFSEFPGVLEPLVETARKLDEAMPVPAGPN